MTLEAGAQIWIPCEVKPGPFSDERLARVRDNGSEWLGFVQTSHLREPILEGATFLDALVVSVAGESFEARMPGEAVTPGLFKGETAKLRPLGCLEA